MKHLCLSILVLLTVMACKTNTQPDTIALPVFSPEQGLYSLQQQISITCPSAGVLIHYTLDGDDPDHNSPIYTEPFTLSEILPAISNRVTIRARAFKQNLGWSGTSVAIFRVEYPQTVAQPVLTPDSGTQELGFELVMSVSTPDAQIRYTLDGSEPSHKSNLYTQPIHISQGGYQSVMAIAFKAGCNPSPFTFAQFFIPLPGPPLILVQGGSFVHGSANVTLSDFYIGKHELIQSHYYSVMNAGLPLLPNELKPGSARFKTPQSTRLEYPVYYASWYDAIEYCNRRSILEDLSPCYSYHDPQAGITGPPLSQYPHYWPAGWKQDPDSQDKISCDWNADGYRLPTEAEWTFAARGGNLSEGLTYSGYKWVDPCAWFDLNSGYSTHSVGMKLRNELYLYDMSGNLSEWCWDRFASLPSGTLSNPTGPASGSLRVLKGGSWSSDSLACMVVSRASLQPACRSAASVGFRVARRNTSP